MLSSPDRDDDLLRERLRELHDVWPGDPADDDPLREARRAAGATDAGGARSPLPRSLLRASCRAILDRLGASATGLPLPPVAPAPGTTGDAHAEDDPRDPR
ncbi:hypothetical protein GW571_00405 [Clavibacter capsici]|uniref:hypothetical protein n=1 Tax=Clavibacter capsici TaxID=1874630 RepID=UPI0014283166|nr:hypothetical protein [Clavibacter capsici]QIS37990.1 hypothetical protein GW572_00420 [Clavibacter capsici]QIS40728.1 hypothetical protein GW571_00405 [Clavibacter capsici]